MKASHDKQNCIITGWHEEMTEIKDILRNALDKGRLLETAVTRALPDYGFSSIRNQLSGVQFGFDILAYRPSLQDGRQEIWKFECKNHEGPVTPAEIAPKLIWNFGRATIDRFVIVSTSKISNDLEHLLSEHTFPMPISIIAGEDLIEFLSSSPSAMETLGISLLTETIVDESVLDREVYPCSSPVALDVVHQLDPPDSFDYTMISGRIVKAFTPMDFRLLLTVTNHMAAPLDIHNISIVTLAHSSEVDRVLRLSKPKGIFNPVELTFRPTTTVHGEVEVLKGKIWRVAPRSTEIACLLLDDNTAPGVYEFLVSARGNVAGQSIHVESCRFALHVPSEHEDILKLNVKGRHYDSPACQVLNLPEDSWRLVKNEVKKQDQAVYLGPSEHEILHGIQDERWVIRRLASHPIQDGALSGRLLSPEQQSIVILDLGTLVDEELYSLEIARLRMTGSDSWQDLFDLQIQRRQDKDNS